MDLQGWSARLKVLAHATRVRLLALLEGEELTVAELSAITQLAQPPVSTHLARPKEPGLAHDRRPALSAYYRDRNSAVHGKTQSRRVALRGRRILKNQNPHPPH